jgi:hypothetical protein
MIQFFVTLINDNPKHGNEDARRGSDVETTNMRNRWLITTFRPCCLLYQAYYIYK